MNVNYRRVMRSPYLSKDVLRFAQEYIGTRELMTALVALEVFTNEKSERAPAQRLTRHELGVSCLGATLVGWTLGDPGLPRLVCASQHHGPENYGASFSLYLSYLLLLDPLFTPLLSRFSFSFFPQQNPDALDARGNWDWMSEPRWERFVERYQYDPRRFDVEHGVPPKHLTGEVAHFRRPEAEALARWLKGEQDRYGSLIYYQSGHAWGILDDPLYLMYPNLSQHDPSHTPWAQAVQRLTQSAPYAQLTTTPPLTDDYHLPEWLEQESDGFYVLPTREEFLKNNPDSQVMCSSMDVFAQLAPQARIMVIEPPIFSSPQLKSHSPATRAELDALTVAAGLHQEAVERCDQLWVEELAYQLNGSTVDQAYMSHHEQLRSIAQLRLETQERRGVGDRWARLVNERSCGDQPSVTPLRSGLVRLATIDQYFNAGHYLALASRVVTDPQLQALSARCQGELARAALSPWPVEWGVFVYLCPLLATVFSEDSGRSPS